MKWSTHRLLFSLLPLAVFAGVFVACEKVSDDETDPIIERYEIDEQRLEVGDDLRVRVVVSDNEELGQMRLRVQEAFSKSFGFWKATRIDDLGGKSYSRTYALTVPDSALAGYYEVAFQVSDERGNGSNDSIQYITIAREDEAPVLIDFETSPAFDGNNTISIGYGDTLSFLGQAFDVDSLNSVEIIVQDAFEASLERQFYGISDTTTTFDFGLLADSVFFNFEENIPTQLLIKVTDAEGHMLREAYEIALD